MLLERIYLCFKSLTEAGENGSYGGGSIFFR
jgi:hypothetical protein